MIKTGNRREDLGEFELCWILKTDFPLKPLRVLRCLDTYPKAQILVVDC